MKTILIIGAGQFQVPVIKRAKKLGCKVIATDYDINAPGFKFADIALNISTLDKEKTLEAAQEYKVDGVLTTSDFPVRTVAYICEILNLIGPSYKTALICTNKYILRECLKEKNISTIRYSLIDKNNFKNIYAILKSFEFPIVLKPVDSSASRGVIKVDNIESVEKAYNESIIYSKTEKVIAEEFIEGNEYSVESITENGQTRIVAITQKITSGCPYFVEERHIIPANLNKIQEEEIKEYVRKCIKVIGLDNSASHLELKLTKNGPIIIEIGARLGGDYITSDLVPLATGIDMLKNAINLSLGLELETNYKYNKFSGIQFITPYIYKYSFNRYKVLSLDKNIVKYEMTSNISDGEFKNSLDRLGYYIVQAERRSELEDVLDRYSK